MVVLLPNSYYTALSGTSMYDSWVYSGFNFALGLPIIFFGIMDRDVSYEYAMANPKVCFIVTVNSRPVYLKLSSRSIARGIQIRC